MLFMAFMGLGNGYAQSAWDFTSLGSSDQSNMGQDDNWKKDSSKDRWSYTAAQTEAPLMANGAELTITQGLLFTTTADANNGSVRFGLGSDARMWANGTKVTITLPNLKKGQELTVEFATSSSGNARGITATNLRDMEGFEKTAARTKATQITIDPANATPEQIAAFQEAQGEVSQALGRLLAITEAYPDLKANEQFSELQAQLEGTENRIAEARRQYNEAVQTYNVSVRKFPNNIWAMIFSFEKKTPFAAEAGAEKAPEVQF